MLSFLSHLYPNDCKAMNLKGNMHITYGLLRCESAFESELTIGSEIDHARESSFSTSKTRPELNAEI